MLQRETLTSEDTMNGTMIDTPEGIQRFALIALKSRLKLESVGMKGRGKSALSQVKAMGIKARTASEALPKYIAMLEEKGILAKA
jgi:hypothetical protein